MRKRVVLPLPEGPTKATILVSKGHFGELHGQRIAVFEKLLCLGKIFCALFGQVENGHDPLGCYSAVDGRGNQANQGGKRGGEIACQLDEQYHGAEINDALPQTVSAPA